MSPYTFNGERFHSLIASLTQVFSNKIDELISMGLLLVKALVLIVSLFAVWFCGLKLEYYIRWDNSFSPDQWLNSCTTLPLNYLITAYLTQLYYYLSLSIHIHECVFFSFLSDNRFNIYFLSKLCKWLLIFYFLLYFSLLSNFVS